MRNQSVPVDPALFAFLYDRIHRAGHIGKYGLPERMSKALGRMVTASKIDRMFRDPLSMRGGDAQLILDLTNLGMAWNNSSETYMLRKSEVFNYKSNAYGNIRELDLESSLSEGLSIEGISKQLMDIDTELFEPSSINLFGSDVDWAEILLEYPDTWRIWVSPNNEILAYWMFVTPRDDWFNNSKLGMYPEHKIVLSTLKPISSEYVNIYGPGLYVGRGVNAGLKKILGALLLTSFGYNIRRMELTGVVFREVCTPVYTVDGWHLAHEHFGLAKGRMPDMINKTYAKEMGWEPKYLPRCGQLPAVYVAEINEQLRKAAGIWQSGSNGPFQVAGLCN